MKKEINIRLKTLYEKRRIFNMRCNIESPISILLDKLSIDEEKINNEQVVEKADKEKLDKNELLRKEKFEKFDKNSQYRIISSNVSSIIFVF